MYFWLYYLIVLFNRHCCFMRKRMYIIKFMMSVKCLFMYKPCLFYFLQNYQFLWISFCTNHMSIVLFCIFSYSHNINYILYQLDLRPVSISHSLVPPLVANQVSSYGSDVQIPTTSSDAEPHGGRMFEHRPSWRVSVGPKVIAAQVTVRPSQLAIFPFRVVNLWSPPSRSTRQLCRAILTALTHSSNTGRAVLLPR